MRWHASADASEPSPSPSEATSIRDAQRARKYAPGIDAIRITAAAMVLFYHYGFYHGGLANVVGGQYLSLPALAAWSNWGWVGVQVFFVISGYVIAQSAERATPYNFMVSRVVRLAPAVWICAPLTFAALMIPHVLPGREALDRLLHSALLIPVAPWIDGVYWTLGIEISFYALVLALLFGRRFYLIKSVAEVLGFASAVFWFAMTALSLHASPTLLARLTLLQQSRALDLLLIHHGCEFALGVLLWRQVNRKPSAAQSACMLVFVLGSCLNIYANNFFLNAELPVGHSALVPIGIWLGAMGLLGCSVSARIPSPAWPSWTAPVLRRVGLMSYPLYLIHQVNGAILMGALIKAGCSQTEALLCGAGCALAASWYISTWLEPPLQRLTREALMELRRLLYEQGVRPALKRGLSGLRGPQT